MEAALKNLSKHELLTLVKSQEQTIQEHNQAIEQQENSYQQTIKQYQADIADHCILCDDLE